MTNSIPPPDFTPQIRPGCRVKISEEICAWAFRNPYAMLRREKGYYEHLARRLSRYLSALAD